MTKRQLIETINRRFQNQWHPNMVASYIALAIEKFLYPQLKADPSNYDMFTKDYENQTVSYDEDREIYYITLPSPVIQLMKTGDGVRDIRTTRGKSITFTPVSANQAKVLNDLEVFKIHDRVRYIVRNGRIEFFDKNTIEKIPTVDLSLAIPFNQYDSDDEVVIPAGAGIDIVNVTIQLMQNKPIDDLINDTNERTK